MGPDTVAEFKKCAQEKFDPQSSDLHPKLVDAIVSYFDEAGKKGALTVVEPYSLVKLEIGDPGKAPDAIAHFLVPSPNLVRAFGNGKIPFPILKGTRFFNPDNPIYSALQKEGEAMVGTVINYTSGQITSEAKVIDIQ